MAPEEGGELDAGLYAFTVHPFDVARLRQKWPVLGYLPERAVESLARWVPPFRYHAIPRVETPAGAAQGWLVAIPLTARQWKTLPDRLLVDRVVQAARVAARLGARVMGLGAYSALPGGAGVEAARRSPIAITTGNSLTVWAALQGAREGARLMGHDLDRAEVAVVGAGGAIGSACARILAREVRRLTLVGPQVHRLEGLADQIRRETGLVAAIATDAARVLPRADVVIAVSSSGGGIIRPEMLKPGAVVCDVAMPRDVDERVAAARDDVLVVDGGLIQVPVDTGLQSDGFPAGTAPACLAETMLLALERRYESFTLGRELRVEQVDEIAALAERHGFRLAGLRSFHRAVDPAQIRRIRERASTRRRQEAVSV